MVTQDKPLTITCPADGKRERAMFRFDGKRWLGLPTLVHLTCGHDLTVTVGLARGKFKAMPYVEPPPLLDVAPRRRRYTRKWYRIGDRLRWQRNPWPGG